MFGLSQSYYEVMTKIGSGSSSVHFDSSKSNVASLDEAKKLYEAMKGGLFGAGTDEQAIFSVLEGKSSEDIRAIKNAYQNHYGRDLVEDLESELAGTFGTESEDWTYAQKLLQGGEENKASSAQRQEDASWDTLKSVLPRVDYSTQGQRQIPLNSKKLLTLLESQSVEENLALNERLVREQGHDLETLARQEGLSNDDINRVLVSLGDSPCIDTWESGAASGATSPEVAVAAIKIDEALSGFGQDIGAVEQAVSELTPAQVEELNTLDYDFNATIEDEWLSEADEAKVRDLITTGKQSRGAKLYDAMFGGVTGFDTNVDALRTELKGKSAAEIESIKAEYASETLRLTGTSRDLVTDIKSEVSGRDAFNVEMDLAGLPDLNRSDGVEAAFTRMQKRFDYEAGNGKGFFDHVNSIGGEGAYDRLLRHKGEAESALELAQSTGNPEDWLKARELLNGVEHDLDSLTGTREAAVDIAVEVGAAVGAGVAIGLSGGTAAPFIVVAAAGTAGGAIGAGVAAYATEGSRLSLEQGIESTARGAAIGVATATGTRALGVKNSLARKVGSEAIEGSIDGGLQGIVDGVKTGDLKAGAVTVALGTIAGGVGGKVFDEVGSGLQKRKKSPTDGPNLTRSSQSTQEVGVVKTENQKVIPPHHGSSLEENTTSINSLQNEIDTRKQAHKENDVEKAISVSQVTKTLPDSSFSKQSQVEALRDHGKSYEEIFLELKKSCKEQLEIEELRQHLLTKVEWDNLDSSFWIEQISAEDIDFLTKMLKNPQSLKAFGEAARVFKRSVDPDLIASLHYKLRDNNIDFLDSMSPAISIFFLERSTKFDLNERKQYLENFFKSVDVRSDDYLDIFDSIDDPTFSNLAKHAALSQDNAPLDYWMPRLTGDDLEMLHPKRLSTSAAQSQWAKFLSSQNPFDKELFFALRESMSKHTDVDFVNCFGPELVFKKYELLKSEEFSSIQTYFEAYFRSSSDEADAYLQLAKLGLEDTILERAKHTAWESKTINRTWDSRIWIDHITASDVAKLPRKIIESNKHFSALVMELEFRAVDRDSCNLLLSLDKRKKQVDGGSIYNLISPKYAIKYLVNTGDENALRHYFESYFRGYSAVEKFQALKQIDPSLQQNAFNYIITSERLINEIGIDRLAPFLRQENIPLVSQSICSDTSQLLQWTHQVSQTHDTPRKVLGELLHYAEKLGVQNTEEFFPASFIIDNSAHFKGLSSKRVLEITESQTKELGTKVLREALKSATRSKNVEIQTLLKDMVFKSDELNPLDWLGFIEPRHVEELNPSYFTEKAKELLQAIAEQDISWESLAKFRARMKKEGGTLELIKASPLATVVKLKLVDLSTTAKMRQYINAHIEAVSIKGVLDNHKALAKAFSEGDVTKEFFGTFTNKAIEKLKVSKNTKLWDFHYWIPHIDIEDINSLPDSCFIGLANFQIWKTKFSNGKGDSELYERVLEKTLKLNASLPGAQCLEPSTIKNALDVHNHFRLPEFTALSAAHKRSLAAINPHAIESLELSKTMFETLNRAGVVHFNLDGDKVEGQLVQLFNNSNSDSFDLIFKLRDDVYVQDHLQTIRSSLQHHEKKKSVAWGGASGEVNIRSLTDVFEIGENSVEVYGNGRSFSTSKVPALHNMVRIKIAKENVGDHVSLNNEIALTLEQIGLKELLSSTTPKDRKQSGVMRLAWQCKPSELSEFQNSGVAPSSNLLSQAVNEVPVGDIADTKIIDGYSVKCVTDRHREYQALGVNHLTHELYMAESLLSIIESKSLLSTLARYKRGIIFDGMSSAADIRTGGADYVFTRAVTDEMLSENTFQPYGIILHITPKVLDRTDWFAFDKDCYGTTKGEMFAARNYSENLISTIHKNKTQNEFMFKEAMSFENVFAISARSSREAENIKIKLRNAQIDEINGVPIDEFVQIRTENDPIKFTTNE